MAQTDPLNHGWHLVQLLNSVVDLGLEPWSSGYGKRLALKRTWIRISAPGYIILLQKNNVCLKKTIKGPGMVHFLRKKFVFLIKSKLLEMCFIIINSWDPAS